MFEMGHGIYKVIIYFKTCSNLQLMMESSVYVKSLEVLQDICQTGIFCWTEQKSAG